jgi:hypothetical protein
MLQGSFFCCCYCFNWWDCDTIDTEVSESLSLMLLKKVKVMAVYYDDDNDDDDVMLGYQSMLLNQTKLCNRKRSDQCFESNQIVQ